LHLEIETYTWDVLPPDLKLDLSASIRREYEWVLNAFAALSVERKNRKARLALPVPREATEILLIVES
jgi:hypothetical protein